MTIRKINPKLLKNKTILFLLIFILGIGVLLYQLYVTTIQTSVIEGIEGTEMTQGNGLSGIISENARQRILDAFSNFFKNKCLTGCVKPTTLNKMKCERVLNNKGKYIYDCPWECDKEKFDNFIKDNPELGIEIKNLSRCSVETEKRDCGSCTPNTVF
jgi:hypothetical protein